MFNDIFSRQRPLTSLKFLMHFSSFSCSVFISFLSLFSVLDSISDRISKSLKFLTYLSSSSNNVFHQYSFFFLVMVFFHWSFPVRIHLCLDGFTNKKVATNTIQ